MKKSSSVIVLTSLAALCLFNGCADKNRSASTAPDAATSTPKAGRDKPAAAATANPAAKSPASESGRPMYYEGEIKTTDLAGRTLRELTLLRNTIYARAGNPFRKKWLHDYFSAQPWYKPLAATDDSKLTANDKKNAAFIAQYEINLPRTELEQRKQQLVKRPFDSLSDNERIELTLLARALGEPVAGEAAAQATPLDNPALLDKLLTVEQLSDYSRRDLRILRNTVYARHGRAFSSQLMQQYFAEKEWYKEDPAYNESSLTDTDRRNIKMILSVEDSLGGPLTEADNRSEVGFLGGA